MAESATDSRKNFLLHIDAFWEKATITPLFSNENWTKRWKSALLAKEWIQLQIFLNGPPTAGTYPPEPLYEESVENPTQATERDTKVCNQQLKVTWQNRCKKIDKIGILCGDRLWEHCDQKATSLLYQFIRTEGRRNFKSKRPQLIIGKESMKELWRVGEESFTKTWNITYDRFVFFSSIQQKKENMRRVSMEDSLDSQKIVVWEMRKQHYFIFNTYLQHIEVEKN